MLSLNRITKCDILSLQIALNIPVLPYAMILTQQIGL